MSIVARARPPRVYLVILTKRETDEVCFVKVQAVDRPDAVAKAWETDAAHKVFGHKFPGHCRAVDLEALPLVK